MGLYFETELLLAPVSKGWLILKFNLFFRLTYVSIFVQKSAYFEKKLLFPPFLSIRSCLHLCPELGSVILKHIMLLPLSQSWPNLPNNWLKSVNVLDRTGKGNWLTFGIFNEGCYAREISRFVDAISAIINEISKVVSQQWR